MSERKKDNVIARDDVEGFTMLCFEDYGSAIEEALLMDGVVPAETRTGEVGRINGARFIHDGGIP